MPLPPFVDIHCHLIPGIDDGAADWRETLAMAQMAAADGIGTIIATPHQLGTAAGTRGDQIRRAAAQVQQFLNEHQVPLAVLPGADVRIEPDMLAGLQSGDVLTLADRRRHVLLELPHELYFPIEPVLAQLRSLGMTGILSHPERNAGILAQPQLIAPLVDVGCLMQVTAGSLMGTFGPHSQRFTEWLITEGLVHFVSTDAHGARSRRPLLRRARDRVAELAGDALAEQLLCTNPAAVAEGRQVQPGRCTASRGPQGWFARRRSA